LAARFCPYRYTRWELTEPPGTLAGLRVGEATSNGRGWKRVEGGGRKGRDGKGRERRESVEGPLLWIVDTPLLLHDHSEILLLLQV